MTRTAARELPRLRDSVTVYREGPRSMRFVRTCAGTDSVFEVDELTVRVVSALDSVDTMAELCAVVGRDDDVTRARVREVLDVLEQERLIAPAGESGLKALAPDEIGRYDRQLKLFREWIADGVLDPIISSPFLAQRELAKSTVTIVGLGAIGGAVARSLAAAGVGRLRLCDPDVVDESNLHRQLLFASPDIGRLKVDVAADRLRTQNDRVVVERAVTEVDADTDLSNLVSGADVVVNCADSPSILATSDWLAAACVPRGIAHIVGGGYGYRVGTLSTSVIPGDTACWSCVRRATAGDVATAGAEMVRPVQRPIGILGALSEVIANLSALDTILLLLGIRPGSANRIVEIEALSLEVRSRRIPRDPECPSCSGHGGGTR